MRRLYFIIKLIRLLGSNEGLIDQIALTDLRSLIWCATFCHQERVIFF